MSGEIFSAPSLAAAVRLAQQFAHEGKYDYFRGQIQDWPLRSSLARRGEMAREDALERLWRFRVWASRRDGMSEAALSPDHATAIAQHYGIPTDFIDITTSPDIAGYFASDPPPTDDGDEHAACILCFRSEELIERWRERFGDFRAPRVVKIDVQNLWRLQAQAGAFLFYPFGEIEASLAPDRIHFSPRGGRSPLPLEQIYPSNKSALELGLDQFFMNEDIRDFNRYAKDEGFYSIEFDLGIADHFRSEYFDRSPDLMNGWNLAERTAWSVPRVENYFGTVGEVEVELPVPEAPMAPEEVISRIARFVRDTIEQDASCRSHTLRFRLSSRPDGVSDKAVEALQRALERLWDGVRAAPFSDHNIATAVAHTVALGLERSRAGGDLDGAVSTLFGTPILVEFGARDRSYSRSVVAEERIRTIARDDLESLVKPQYRDDVASSVRVLLHAIFSPAHLFEFSDFATFFVEHVVPGQVLSRASSNALLFSPADLDTFGRP